MFLVWVGYCTIITPRPRILLADWLICRGILLHISRAYPPAHIPRYNVPHRRLFEEGDHDFLRKVNNFTRCSLSRNEIERKIVVILHFFNIFSEICSGLLFAIAASVYVMRYVTRYAFHRLYVKLTFTRQYKLRRTFR